MKEEQTTLDLGQKPKTPSKKRAKKAAEPVPTTKSGKSSGDIIGDWIDEVVKVVAPSAPHPPGPIIARLGKQIKAMILEDYQEAPIKNGLLVWTARWMENPSFAPEHLHSICWNLLAARDGIVNPEVKRMRGELQGMVARLAPRQDARRANAEQRTATRESALDEFMNNSQNVLEK